MKNKNAEKNKIIKQLDELQRKKWAIEKEERLEHNKTLCGRYFKQWFDVSQSYTQFTKVFQIDDFGNLLGFCFNVYDVGTEILFSNIDGLTSIDPNIDKRADEISSEEFYQVKKDIIDRLNKGYFRCTHG